MFNKKIALKREIFFSQIILSSAETFIKYSALAKIIIFRNSKTNSYRKT